MMLGATSRVMMPSSPTVGRRRRRMPNSSNVNDVWTATSPWFKVGMGIRPPTRTTASWPESVRTFGSATDFAMRRSSRRSTAAETPRVW
jgi:hypothetical protein